MSQAIAKSHTPSLSADVLLVTVTKVEAQAVLSIIEEERGDECERHYIDQKTYYDLGLIGEARVFMVRSEMGAVGAGGALLTVQTGLQVLSPSAVIMVGIAFGISQTQQIGDILVSQQLQEYELQRLGTGSDGKLTIKPRGERVGASSRLLDRFRDGDMYWEGAKVSFGLVLSGQKLIDNLEVRNQLLAHWSEAIGGEMEGAGLYAAAKLSKVDWILVKAICDWADGKKHEHKSQRQKQAAENAANFTMHVIKRGGFPQPERRSANKAEDDSLPSSPDVSRAEMNLLLHKLSEWKVIHHDVQKTLDGLNAPIEFLDIYRFQPASYLLDQAGYKWQELCVRKLKSIPSRWALQYVQPKNLSDLEETRKHFDEITRQLMGDVNQDKFKWLRAQLIDIRGILWNMLTEADQEIMLLVNEAIVRQRIK